MILNKVTDGDLGDLNTPEPHGGNIYRLAEELNISYSEVLDFSASTNPLGVSKSVMVAIKDCMMTLNNYPDPDATQLRHEIARRLNIDSESILCGNGSTELIYLVVRALKPERLFVPVPAYSEYERAAKSLQAINKDPLDLTYFFLWDNDGFRLDADKFIKSMSGGDNSATYRSALTTSADMVFICNPNNPTGRLISKDDMIKIADAAKRLKCYLVVDEAFMDFTPSASIVKEVEGNPYLIVLRSLTKFYALSGLRIGYGVIPMAIMDMLKQHKEPWTVSTLAQEAGITALNDMVYGSETFKVLAAEKKTMEDGLKLLDIVYFPSDVNFYLLKMPNAKQVVASLRRKGILVRDCSNFMGLDDTYIRVAVKSNRENMRLLKELARL
jgi:threonine-phosphate decarboxylase